MPDNLQGDVDLARDVVQDTFIRLCRMEREALGANPAPWLFAVCRNRALDVLRKQGRLRPLTEACVAVTPGDDPDPAENAEQRDGVNAIWEILATLPKNQQEVVRLKFQEEMSYRDISQVTQLSVSNVGYLLHTAIHAIRQRMQTAEESARNSRE